jgi:subfamily B ATP-binding cassette protein HlyB/CyaB
MDTDSDRGSVEAVDQGKVPTPGGEVAIQIRLMAVAATARFHGAELDRGDLRATAEVPSPAALTNWLRAGGLWAKAIRLPWKQLISLDLPTPVVLLLNDGSAALLVANDKKRDVVYIRHSRLAQADPSVAVNQSELARAWAGEVLLIRAKRTATTGEDAPFSLGWVAQLVWMERHAMRDVGLASLVLSILTVLPALIFRATRRTATRAEMASISAGGRD